MGTLTTSAQTILVLFGIVISANAFTKYGRSCKDIGCLPSEDCTMAYSTCGYRDQDGKDCGQYPTCTRRAGGASSAGPGASLNPQPDNSRPNQPSVPNSNHGPPIDPNNVFGNPNRNQQQNPWNNFPIFPAPTGSSGMQYPQYPQYPQNPQNNPQFPPNPNYPNTPFGAPPQPQFPFAFGNPPPQVPAYRTTPQPSLLDQFLYNKSGKNAAPQHLPSNIIFIICAFVVSLVSLRRNSYFV